MEALNATLKKNLCSAYESWKYDKANKFNKDIEKVLEKVVYRYNIDKHTVTRLQPIIYFMEKD